MDDAPLRRTDELDSRHRRNLRRGVAASVLIHVLLIFIFLGERAPLSPFAAAGPRAGDDRAAAGGGMRAVTIYTPPQAEPIVRPPEPVLIPDIVPELQEFEPEAPQVTIAEFEGLAGREKGPEQGPGIEGGTGRGDGGTAMEGRFRVIPPSPRALILPPSNRPGNVRGKEIAVWVFVNETGRVVADSTRLQPPTGDSRFDARLKGQAADWIFEPARRGGRPVAEWFQYVISL